MTPSGGPSRSGARPGFDSCPPPPSRYLTDASGVFQPLLSSLKQNKRSLFARPGCALMERILFSQQRGLWEMCVLKTGNSLCFLWLERASQFQVGVLQIFTRVGTVSPRWGLIYAYSFFLIEVMGTQLEPRCPTVVRCVFYAHGLGAHLSYFISTTDMTNYLTEHNYTAHSNIYFRDVGNSVCKITKNAQLMQK